MENMKIKNFHSYKTRDFVSKEVFHPTENQEFSVPFKTRSFEGYKTGNFESYKTGNFESF
ncbi:MAG: hypothetical protein WC584_03000 [Candidatus Pacearchaeota archaeon]